MNQADRELEGLMKEWISVSEKDDPAEFKAWARYRSTKHNCQYVPKAFTVPTPFPPITPEAERYYDDALQKIRQAVGWNNSKSRSKVLPFRR